METPSLPTVSVVIPCYNGSAWVLEAIRSAMQTGYPNLDILVVDDQSTDDSAQVVADFVLRGPDQTVRLLTHADGLNHDCAASRNLGIRHTTGDYVCFLDQDDIYFTTRFANAVAALEADRDLDACFEPFCYVQSGETRLSDARVDWMAVSADLVGDGIPDIEFPLSEDTFQDCLEGKCPLHIGTITVRRAVLDEIGLFDESALLPDRVFLLKLLARGRVRQVGRLPVEGYRIHSDSFCSKHEEDPRMLSSPIEALLRALTWMRKHGVCDRYVAATEDAIRGKIWFYCPKAIEKGRGHVSWLAWRMLAAARTMPRLWACVRFWKVLLRLAAAWWLPRPRMLARASEDG